MSNPEPSRNKSPFIDNKTAPDAYDESVKWFRPYFDPLDEFERLARNKPSTKIAPELPKVTDGTLAAIVQEQPKRIIQQVATGLIHCQDYPEYAAIADIVHRTKIIPLYNRMGNALQKQWNMLSKSMTYGRSVSYTFFTSTNGQMHTDFIIPYAKDVLSEKGKVFAPDSNVSFLRSWYSKRDLKAIINRESELEKTHKDYTSDWDLTELAKFMEGGASAKPADQQTPAEKEKGGDAGGFEVIHAFQKGIGAESYSFSPRYEAGKCLRRKINRDPRGNMPLDYLYCNIDLSNPMGRGQVELSGGVQNLIDQQMQMFQFMTTLEMGPPLMVYGNVNKASLKFRPNALWDMGSSPNNKVEPYQVANSSTQNFGNNYGLLKSQILNLNSSQDHSISAESGSPTQSKTDAGVNAAEARLGVSDNYLRKQFESWFADQAETSINLQFAEMTGKQTVKLEGDDLREIKKSPAAVFLKGDVLTIPYKEINDVVFKFEVNPSSSEIKEDADNVEKLTEVYKILQSDPDPALSDKKQKLLKVLINEIGAEGTDDLFPDEEVDENGQPIQASQGPDPNMIMQMVQEAVAQAMAQKPQDDPMLKIFKDLPEDAKKAVLAKYQIQAEAPSPVERKLDIEAHDSVTRADQQISGAEQADKQAQMQHEEKMNPTPVKPVDKPKQETPQPQDGMHALEPQEQQLVEGLLQRGFSEQDVEQAMVMIRSGRNPQEVVQTLAAKYQGVTQ